MDLQCPVVCHHIAATLIYFSNETQNTERLIEKHRASILLYT